MDVEALFRRKERAVDAFNGGFDESPRVQVC